MTNYFQMHKFSIPSAILSTWITFARPQCVVSRLKLLWTDV